MLIVKSVVVVVVVVVIVIVDVVVVVVGYCENVWALLAQATVEVQT